MLLSSIRIAYVLRAGPCMMLALLLAYDLISRPSLDLTGISFFSFFEFGTIAYLLVFVVVAMSSRSLIAAFLQFFPGGTTEPLYFLRLLVIALWSLSWGVSAGTAFNLMKGVGANQSALVTATFVQYQRQPKSNCDKEAVLATKLGEIALCVDGFPSKIHPRFPVDASLAPGDLVVLTGRRNRFVFIPEKGVRLNAAHRPLSANQI